MLMEVKNQIKISLLSIKYALQREMLNRVSFFMNIVFMILNNSCFLIQWFILFSLKEDIGGYDLKMMMLLWGFASFTYGIAHFFFYKVFSLSDIINSGKLDSFLVQPKNVLLSCITTDVKPSAIGDLIYGIIMLVIYGFSFKNLFLFIFLGINGGLIITAIAVITGSLSFWLGKSDVLADTINSSLINFDTYPGGIFKGAVRVLLYTIIPVALIGFMPVEAIINFNIYFLIANILYTVFFVSLAFLIFNLGLKKYSSSNLMIARI